MVPEASLERSESGLAPGGDGWFVVNVADAAWETNEAFGAACFFEGDEAPFPDLGLSVRVFMPGQPHGLYHSESTEEAFLVLSGECLLIVEDEERHLRAWDFFHCPPDTGHVFVGAGDGPCVVLMTGSPRTSDVRYVPFEAALSRGAAVELESTSPETTLGAFPRWRRRRPETWLDLPWAARRGRARPRVRPA